MWIDLILIAFILVVALICMARGLLKTVLSFAGVLFALILSFVLVKPVVQALNGSALYNFVSEKALNALSGIGGLMTTEIPSYDSLVTTLSASLPKVIAEALASSAASLIGTAANQTVAELLTPGLTNIIMNIVVFIGLFIITNLLFLIIKAFAKALTSIPVIKTVDKVLGFLLGIILGIAFSYLILLILSLFTGTEGMQPFFTALEATTLTKAMYNNNLLLLIGKQLIDTGTVDVKQLVTASPSAA